MNTESLEALEHAFIGSLLLRDDAVFETPAGFTGAVLQHDASRAVFAAVERLAKAKRPVDLPLVAAEAKLTREEATWLRGTMELGTLNSVRPYAEKLIDRHQRTNAVAVLEEAAKNLRSAAGPAADILGGLTAQLSHLETPGRAEVESFTDIATDSLGHWKSLATGLPTGFPGLDAKVRIQPGNLVVLAAQSGMGKSTLALNIAENVARRFGHVLFHSLEMDKHELWARIAARAARVPVDSILAGRDLAPEADRTIRGLPAEGLRMLFNCGHFSLGSMLHITEKAHRKHGLKLAVFDYLGLTEVEADARVTEEARLATVTRQCKQLAARLRIPILLVAQLNREVDRRQDARSKEGEDQVPPPKLSDLRGSGRIGQDANVVLMLHNPFAQSKDDWRRLHGPYQLRIEKSRMGRRGKTEVYAHLEFAEFTENASGKATLYARSDD